jgi:hypothetical protein
MTSSDVSCTAMTGRSQHRLKSTRTAAVGRECEVEVRAERGHLDAPFPPVPDVGDFLIE